MNKRLEVANVTLNPGMIKCESDLSNAQFMSHHSVSQNTMLKSMKRSSGKSNTTVSAKVNDYRKVWNLSFLLFFSSIKQEKLCNLYFILNFQNTKPLMEKRRRERINRSLEELKNLILDQTHHNVSLLFLLLCGGRIFFQKNFVTIKITNKQ